MIFNLIKNTIRRFFELFITTALSSATITLLYIAGMLESQTAICWGLLSGIIIFCIINIKMLRQCYFELKSRGQYFFINISAYLLFFASSLAIYFLCSDEFFTWTFAITKFAKYTTAEFEPLTSLIFFHIVGLLTVIFAPSKMEWVFEKDDWTEYFEKGDLRVLEKADLPKM